MEYVVDANSGFVRRPGEEWSSAIFTTALEELTIVELEPSALAHLPDLRSSAGPFTVDPPRALAHRLLVHHLRSDDLDIELGVLDLVHECLAEPAGYRPSRVFHEVIGVTIAQYRTRLRVHAVLERLDAGDEDLAAVAATTGFADHSHMTRTLNGQLGARPSEIRARLRAARAGIGRLAARSA